MQRLKDGCIIFSKFPAEKFNLLLKVADGFPCGPGIVQERLFAGVESPLGQPVTGRVVDEVIVGPAVDRRRVRFVCVTKGFLW